MEVRLARFGSGVAAWCRRHELVGIAGVAIATSKLTSTIGVDTPGHPDHAFRGDAAEDRADLQGAELDEMAVIGVRRLKGHACDAGWRGRLVENGEERFGGSNWFRHLFASVRTRIGGFRFGVKGFACGRGSGRIGVHPPQPKKDD